MSNTVRFYDPQAVDGGDYAGRWTLNIDPFSAPGGTDGQFLEFDFVIPDPADPAFLFWGFIGSSSLSPSTVTGGFTFDSDSPPGWASYWGVQRTAVSVYDAYVAGATTRPHASYYDGTSSLFDLPFTVTVDGASASNWWKNVLEPADFFVDSSYGDNSGNSFVVDAPMLADVGDLMIVAIWNHEAHPITPAAGWVTLDDFDVGAFHHMSGFSRVFEAGDTSWTFNRSVPWTSASRQAWVVVAYRGVTLAESSHTVNTTVGAPPTNRVIETPTYSTVGAAVELDFFGTNIPADYTNPAATKITDTDSTASDPYMSALHRGWFTSLDPYGGTYSIAYAVIGVLLQAVRTGRGLVLGPLTLN